MHLERDTTRYRNGAEMVEKTLILQKKIMKKLLKFNYFYSKMAMKWHKVARECHKVVEDVENLVETSKIFKVFHS